MTIQCPRCGSTQFHWQPISISLDTLPPVITTQGRCAACGSEVVLETQEGGASFFSLLPTKGEVSDE